MNNQEEKLTVLDLFSGIGGFSLGFERSGFETIAFCEIESFCQKVLSKHWPQILIEEDLLLIIRNLYAY
jgi:DNA (cytosine-5)-methyltransferase 1